MRHPLTRVGLRAPSPPQYATSAETTTCHAPKNQTSASAKGNIRSRKVRLIISGNKNSKRNAIAKSSERKRFKTVLWKQHQRRKEILTLLGRISAKMKIAASAEVITCRNSAYSWNNPSRDNYSMISFCINKRSHLAFRSCQGVQVMSSSYQARSSSCRAVSSWVLLSWEFSIISQSV